jgi:hypothetical protein
MLCQYHPPWLDHSNYTWQRVQVMKLFIMQFSSILTWSLIGPNILLSTLFSNTLSLCSSLNVRDQVSHPYRTTGKIVVLYVTSYSQYPILHVFQKLVFHYCKRNNPESRVHKTCSLPQSISWLYIYFPLIYQISEIFQKGSSTVDLLYLVQTRGQKELSQTDSLQGTITVNQEVRWWPQQSTKHVTKE